MVLNNINSYISFVIHHKDWIRKNNQGNKEQIEKLTPSYITFTESDIIIGSRYIEGGKTSNGFVSIMMSYAVNLTYSKLFGLSIKDVSNSFRIYRTDLLKNIQLQCNNFDVVEEILIKIYRKFPSVKIAEVPIFFHKRDEGHSKRNLLRFIVSYIVSIIRLFKIRNNYWDYIFRLKCV